MSTTEARGASHVTQQRRCQVWEQRFFPNSSTGGRAECCTFAHSAYARKVAVHRIRHDANIMADACKPRQWRAELRWRGWRWRWCSQFTLAWKIKKGRRGCMDLHSALMSSHILMKMSGSVIFAEHFWLCAGARWAAPEVHNNRLATASGTSALFAALCDVSVD